MEFPAIPSAAALTVILALSQTLTPSPALAAHEGTAVFETGGDVYVRLFNAQTTVVLDPNVGGRVIEYALDGVNVLYRVPEKPAEGQRTITPDAGRFDIGPEMLVPRRTPLWSGKWAWEITGPRTARLTSEDDPSSGVRLVRDFRLDPASSHLSCTQTIINISGQPKRYNHWSRTLAVGGGICIVPLTEYSRFPLGYIYYGPGAVLNYRHEEHPSIRVRDGYLELLGTPPQPKFGIDSYAGWLAYLTPNNIAFIKKFPVYPERVYGEVAGYTISLWYFENETCELEPIGPLEFLEPGGKASFTEDWYLEPWRFPGKTDIDLKAFEAFVKERAR